MSWRDVLWFVAVVVTGLLLRKAGPPGPMGPPGPPGMAGRDRIDGRDGRSP